MTGGKHMPGLLIFKWIDRNIEKIVVLICYVAMAGIIFVEVIRRFVFKEQAAWSTTIPIYLFLWVTWMGAAYNTRIRTHLRFDELRVRLPYGAQFACLCLDVVLWLVFGIIVTVYSIEQVQLSYDNFAIAQGTDDVMQWWFYLATPVAWTLLMVRALQNLWEDWRTFRAGRPFKLQVSILGD
ncbi:MAG: TRAP transporter small permease [Rhodospirillales bacterium]|nr:TRAP transporter small permease [Rhodospirillales bacterium]